MDERQVFFAVSQGCRHRRQMEGNGWCFKDGHALDDKRCRQEACPLIREYQEKRRAGDDSR